MIPIEQYLFFAVSLYAFFHLSISKKTTGAILTVDGGNIAASLR